MSSTPLLRKTVVGLMLCAWTGFRTLAAPVVSSVVCQQRTPWNGLVDIDFVLSGIADGDIAMVFFAAGDLVQNTNVPMVSLRGPGVDWPASNGVNRVVWNAAADAPSLVSSNVAVAVGVGPAQYAVVDLSGGATATNFPVALMSGIPAGGWTAAYKTTNLVLRRIAPATFTMGSPTSELGRASATVETQHAVTLQAPYYVGVFEVTQKQWSLVMGTTPASLPGDTRPVETVSYADLRGAGLGASWPATNAVDAASFFGVLRRKTGLTFDLPTEAQWEHACRAGTTNALNSGKDLTSTTSSPELNTVGRYWYNGGDSSHHAVVGSLATNRFGLFDLHGNVAEWCLDWYGSFATNALVDPRGPTSGTDRTVRGGLWSSDARECRSAAREYRDPSRKGAGEGFRVSAALTDATERGLATNGWFALSSARVSPGFALDTRYGPSTVLVAGRTLPALFYSTAWQTNLPPAGVRMRLTAQSVNGGVRTILVETNGVAAGSVVWAPSNGVYTVRHTLTDATTDAVLDELSTLVRAARLTVHSDAARPDDTGDGLDWTTAKRSLQASVDLFDLAGVEPGDTVWVADGTYEPIETANKALVIRSLHGAEATRLQGTTERRCAHLGDDGAQTNTVLVGFTLAGGTADDGGGALGGTLERCVVRDNTAAGTGGGARYTVAINCLVVRNTATDGGGLADGIANQCTVSGNFASRFGGGLANVAARNTITWGNANSGVDSSTPGAEGRNRYAGTLFHGCTPASELLPGDTNCLGADPLFVDAANNDFRLDAASPCIDVGSNGVATWPTDLAGWPRVVNGIVDLGAYEYFHPFGSQSNLVWTSGGQASWFPQRVVTNREPVALQSGAIGHNEASWVSAQARGKGTLTFYWRTSSAANDYLTLYVDGRTERRISGETGWVRETVVIPATGNHTFQWEYARRKTGAGASNAGWLEAVSWSPTTANIVGLVTPATRGYTLGGGTHLVGDTIALAAFPNPVDFSNGWYFVEWTDHVPVSVRHLVVTEDNQTFTASLASSIAEALDTDQPPTSLDWLRNGIDLGWSKVPGVGALDSEDALRSGPVGDDEVSRVSTTVQGAGRVGFWWRVSSEAGYDELVFSIDGTDVSPWISGRMGSDEWAYVSHAVSGAGPHVLAWEYRKDGSDADGDDEAWLDRVTWAAANSADSFEAWARDNAGYTGNTPGALGTFFASPGANGIPHGFAYAFGNILDTTPLLNIVRVGGVPIVEYPVTRPSAAAYVRVVVQGTTNLSATVWDLRMVLPPDRSAKPSHLEWATPAGPLPGAAFFRLKAELYD